MILGDEGEYAHSDNCEIEFYDMFRVLNFILVIGIEKTIPTCTVIRCINLIMTCILI